MKKELFFKILKKSSVVLLFFTTLSMQHLVAQKTVTGTVLDETNSGIPGVNIFVKGSNNGVSTNFDGNFSIQASDDAVLVFSYMGYSTQEIKVGNKNTINISLQPDSDILDEVVVIGYGSQKKSDLTGAVATVKVEDIEKYTYASPTDALQGRMSGVSVQAQGGAPGANPVVSIRGFGTLSDAGPLYVIDGILTGNMNSINPNDIASISVLKDASASAIYGSRAANGVIIITTKQGQKGDLKIDLDMNYGIQNVINEYDWANNRQYADIVNQAQDNDGGNRFPANDTDFDPNNSSDLYGDSFRAAPVQNTNLRVSGGGENILYSMSLSNFKQDGIVKYSDFERSTFRTNATMTKGKFKAMATLGLTKTVNNPNPYFNKERNLLPTINLKDENGDWNVSDAPDGMTLGQFYGQDAIYNELGMAALEDRTNTGNNLLGNLNASYEILKGLTYKISFGLEKSYSTNYRYRPVHEIFSATGGTGLSELWETKREYTSQLLEHTLNYKLELGKHKFDIIGGYTEQENVTVSRGINARSFPSEEVINPETAEDITIDTFENTSTIQSFLGRFNYNYDDRYLLTASIRQDKSSLFLKELNTGNFPSAAVAWNLSNESFMEDFTALSNIKFRASYGEIGSNNVPVYAIDAELNLNSEYIVGETPGRVTGYSITKGVNQLITWETTKTTDIGADFATLNGRLNVSLGYFKKESEDVLVGLKPPFWTGVGNDIPRNTATIENTGFEFMSSYSDQVGDLRFNATLNFSIMNNEVTSLGPSSPIREGSFTSNTIKSTKTDVGQPISSFFGYVVDGIYQTDQEAIDANDTVGNMQAGDFRFKDIDGDGDIDEDDQTYIGNPTPNFEYGINLSAEYKNWDLNLFFNGVSGNKILNGTKYRGIFDFNGNYFAERLNSWSPTNTDATLPRNTRSDPGFNRRMSTFYLEDGAYFRLKNAQIGYRIPAALTNKIKIEKIRLYGSATNLFTLTKYTGYYPEVGRNGRGGSRKIFNSGVDEGAYPVPRTFQLGIQVTF